MGWRGWWDALRRTAHEFREDELAARSAALTYYSVMSLFPALLLAIAVLGLAGESVTDAVLDDAQQALPGSAHDVAANAIEELQRTSGGVGSVLAVVGLAWAVWSASGYVRAFIQAANAVYEVPEGRPLWKVTPVRIALTLGLMLLGCAGALVVVVTGGIARRTGDALGLGDAALTAWAFAKWPTLFVLFGVMLALLYWCAPNVRSEGWRWVTPGSLVALVLWMGASALFAVYVANFSHYNQTYGAIGGVMVFLVWLRLSNLAILLGLEFDAELARGRAIAGGLPEEEEPYVHPRDTRKWHPEDYRQFAE
ncbi:YihY/virulence factor BrkB family protein [Streptodolium elevatio]